MNCLCEERERERLGEGCLAFWVIIMMAFGVRELEG